MTAYKFAVILEGPNDYLRRVDFSYLGDFIDIDELRVQFDDSGIAYICEDVNMPRTEKLLTILEENGIVCTYTSTKKWNKFEALT